TRKMRMNRRHACSRAKLQASQNDQSRTPYMSGVSDVDQSRSMYLAELAFEFVKIVLKPHGCFLVKVFQGAEFEAFIKLLRSHFDRIVMRKPEASRNRSRELYVLASDLHS
ncbi:MAG: hypothetical protein KJ588_04930, partial [Gammaproteobacteria bacterium]|nr:hypothetical protein [Gammaproteobacteria bacterium]